MLLPHYHYLDWPDHGVPASTSIIRGLLRHLRLSLPPSPLPIVIHCSAGIGRSGAFLTVDYSVRRVLAGDLSAVDIAETVKALRAQRGGMVQTRVSSLCRLSAQDKKWTCFCWRLDGRRGPSCLFSLFVLFLTWLLLACMAIGAPLARHWQKELRQHALPSLFDLHKERALITIDVFTAGSVSFLLCCCEGRTRGSDCMGH